MHALRPRPSRALWLSAWGLLMGGLWVLAYIFLLRWHDPSDVAHTTRWAIIPWVLLLSPVVSLAAGTLPFLSPSSRLIGLIALLLGLEIWCQSLPQDRQWEFPHPPGQQVVCIVLEAMALALLLGGVRQAARVLLLTSGPVCLLHAGAFLLIGSVAGAHLCHQSSDLIDFLRSEPDPLGYMLPKLGWASEMALMVLLAPVFLPPRASWVLERPLGSHTTAAMAYVWGVGCANVALECWNRVPSISGVHHSLLVATPLASALIGVWPRSAFGLAPLLLFPVLALPFAWTTRPGIEALGEPILLGASLLATGLSCRQVLANRLGWWQRMPLSVLIFGVWVLGLTIARGQVQGQAPSVAWVLLALEGTNLRPEWTAQSDLWSLLSLAGLMVLALAAHPPHFAPPEPPPANDAQRLRRGRFARRVIAAVLTVTVLGILVQWARAQSAMPVPTAWSVREAPVADPPPERSPARAVLRLGSRRIRLDRLVDQVALSRDGRRIAFGDDRGVHVSDPEGRLLRILGPASDPARSAGGDEPHSRCGSPSLVALAFSPFGERLAMADTCGRIQIRDTRMGREGGWLIVQDASAQTLRFSSDGRYLAVVGRHLTVWDAVAGRCILNDRDTTIRMVLRAFTSWREPFCQDACDFSPDGRNLAVGDGSGSVRVFELASGRVVWRVDGDGAGVHSLRFSRGDDVLGVGTWKGLDLREAAGGKLLRRYPIDHLAPDCPGRDARARSFVAELGRGHLSGGLEESTLALCTIPDGGTQDQLDVGLHQRLEALSPTRAIAAWSRPGTSGRELVFLWDLALHCRLAGEPSGDVDALAVAFAPDGRTLLVGCRDGRVREWGLASGRLRRVFGHAGETDRLDTFIPLSWRLEPRREDDSPVYRTFSVAARSSLLAKVGPRGGLEIWDLVTARLARAGARDGDRAGVEAAWFSADGHRLAVWGTDHLEILTVPDWSVIRRIRVEVLRQRNRSRVPTGCLTPDGQAVVYVSDEKPSQVVMYDLASGGSETLDTLLTSLSELEFSRDGRDLFAAGSGGVCRYRWAVGGLRSRFLRAGDGSAKAPVPAPVMVHRASDVDVMAVSPSGSSVAVADGNAIRIVSVPSGREILCLKNRTEAVSDLAFSPDGKLLAWASEDTTAIVCDVAAL